MSLLKKNQLKTQRSQLGPSKWLILLILCPVCFTMTAAEMGCPVWGIIDGFKREGLERGKVSFILIFSIFLLPITLYLFFSILVVGFNSEAMPIFWDCQANVGVNTIRENSVEIHFFLCQPQIPCLPCKDDENTIFFLLRYFQIYVIYYSTGFSHSNEVDVTIEDITDATLFTPNVPICKLKPLKKSKNPHLINLSIISVLKERYRVLATDYTNFAVEYSCSDTSLMSRKGKEIIIILLSNKKCMSATKKQ